MINCRLVTALIGPESHHPVADYFPIMTCLVTFYSLLTKYWVHNAKHPLSPCLVFIIRSNVNHYNIYFELID